MSVNTGKSTKVGVRANGQIKTTLPRAIARAIDLDEREDPVIHFTVVPTDAGGITYQLTLGPDVEKNAVNVTSPAISATGQVSLYLPRFQAEAWNVGGLQIHWPDPESLDVAEDGRVTIEAALPEWEPAYPVDMFSAGGFAHSSTIGAYGEDQQNVESAFPTSPAKSLGIASSQQRVEITFDSVDGRVVLVATPTDAERKEVRNSVSVNMAGPNKSQARFNAGRIAHELGVADRLDDDTVPLRWFAQDAEHLIGFVRSD